MYNKKVYYYSIILSMKTYCTYLGGIFQAIMTYYYINIDYETIINQLHLVSNFYGVSTIMEYMS